jgi:hypothetical protein
MVAALRSVLQHDPRAPWRLVGFRRHRRRRRFVVYLGRGPPTVLDSGPLRSLPLPWSLKYDRCALSLDEAPGVLALWPLVLEVVFALRRRRAGSLLKRLNGGDCTEALRALLRRARPRDACVLLDVRRPPHSWALLPLPMQLDPSVALAWDTGTGALVRLPPHLTAGGRLVVAQRRVFSSVVSSPRRLRPTWQHLISRARWTL